HVVEVQVARDLPEPGREAGAVLEGLDLAEGEEERFLRQVLALFRGEAPAAEPGEERGGEMVIKPLEAGLDVDAGLDLPHPRVHRAVAGRGRTGRPRRHRRAPERPAGGLASAGEEGSAELRGTMAEV